MTLTLESVSKTVGDSVHLHPVGLTLARGTMNVLLGPTLAGKTTLMRLMAGLDRPSAGRLLWDGRDVTGVRVQDRAIAMVYQQFINYPSVTVYENVASPLRLAGVGRAEIDRRVREVAALLKMTDQLDKKPPELSGGQQQRCALARALVKKADLVLLDEPLVNLDYKLREELRAEIPRMFEKSGAIFVYATTEPAEALMLGGNTACLWEGRVTQFGPTAEVYRQPRDAVTASVFSDPPMNFVAARKAEGRLHFPEGRSIAAGRFAGLPDGPYRAGFRPNHLLLDPAPGEALAFETTVAVTEITGSESFMHVDHAGDRWVALAHGVRRPAIGARQTVWIEARRLFLFGEDGRLAAAPDLSRAA